MWLKRVKKSIVTMLCVVLLMAMAMPVLAEGQQQQQQQQQVTIWVDGEQIEYTEQAPFIVEGTTLASAVSLFERLDIVLLIDEETETIVGINDQGAFAMQVGEHTAIVNDDEVELLEAPRIVEDELFVPVRFVSEAAGYDVEWGGSSWQVLITSIAQDLEDEAGDVADGEAVEGGSRGFLWKTEHGDNTVYLLGSIHVASEAMYPLREEISDAFFSSDYLVLEVDISKIDENESNELVMVLGTYQDGTTLPDHISPELYEKLGDVLLSIGIEHDALDMFKPWAISTTLQSLMFASAGFESAIGIDMALMSAALELGMPILQLETMEEQLELFSDLSPEAQAAMLEETIDEFDTIADVIRDYEEMWITGDEEMLLEITLLEGETEEQQAWIEKLLDERNINMVEQIDQYLQDDDGTTYFVVVGGAHMLGEMGIIQLLEEKGYIVTRE